MALGSGTLASGSLGNGATGTITLGNASPVATITSPVNLSSWIVGASVSFAGSATDAEDGTLTGSSLAWTSSINGVIGTGTAFSTTALSLGTHTITLTATDSSAATGTATRTITVAATNTAPTATITAPATGGSVSALTNINFTGTGSDTEDGTLTGASLAWSSSINGALGTGVSINVSTLSVGVHMITLTATDSGGLTDSKTITVTITGAATGPSLFTTQPPTTLTGAYAGGTAMATVVAKMYLADGTTVDTSYTGAATIAVTSGTPGRINSGTSTVNCVAGVATFAGLVVNGEGAITFTVTAGPYTAAVSNTCTVTNAARAVNQTLIAACGGNTKWPGVWDARIALALTGSTVTTWSDAVGTAGGRTPALDATAVTAPLLGGTRFSGNEFVGFTAASAQSMVTARMAGLTFLGSSNPPLYIMVIARATGDGAIAGIVNDETLDTASPFAMITSAAGNWGADLRFTPGTVLDTNGRNTTRTAPNSGTARDGNTRFSITGKATNTGQNQDIPWRYLMSGRQSQYVINCPNGVLTNAGGQKVSFGRLGTSYANAEILWVGLYTGEITQAVRVALDAFAVAQFSVVKDTSKRGTIICNGSSMTYGSQSSDPQSLAIGSGTTAWPYVMVNRNSGHGTLTAQGFDTADSHAYNHGISGGRVADMLLEWPISVQCNADGSRTGPFIVVSLEIGNEIQGNGAGIIAGTYTLTTILNKMIAYKALVTAQSGTLIWLTCPDRGAGHTGGNVGGTDPTNNSTGFYFDTTNTTLSRTGQMAMDVNTALRTNLSLYGHYLVDLEADASNRFKINRGLDVATGTQQACLHATTGVPNGFPTFSFATATYKDTVHFVDNSYAVTGGLVRDVIDGTESILWPGGYGTGRIPLPTHHGTSLARTGGNSPFHYPPRVVPARRR